MNWFKTFCRKIVSKYFLGLLISKKNLKIATENRKFFDVCKRFSKNLLSKFLVLLKALGAKWEKTRNYEKKFCVVLQVEKREVEINHHKASTETNLCDSQSQKGTVHCIHYSYLAHFVDVALVGCKIGWGSGFCRSLLSRHLSRDLGVILD